MRVWSVGMSAPGWSLRALLLAVALVGCKDAPTASTATGALVTSEVCNSAATPAPIPCEHSSDCGAGLVCTREWNRDVARMLTAAGASGHLGHCLDPSRGGVDHAAVQADLDTLAGV